MSKTKANNLSSEVQGDVDELDDTLKGIEKHLEPFFKASLKETKSNLTGLQIAKLNIVIAYSINTLFYMYLKTQGINPKEHQVMTELDRVRLYIKKVKELTDKENPQKPSLRLNQEAAQRFINHAIGAPMDTSKTETESEQKKEQDKPTEKKKKEKGKNKEKDKGGKSSEQDKENKVKPKNKEEKENDKQTPKSNKRQSPDKVTENTDKKKRRK